MSAAAEDLEYNPFYRVLQETFPATFEEAQQKCHVICIPQAASLRNVDIDQKFIDTHILQPSPFFKGEFITSDADSSGKIHIENNVIEIGEGLSDKTIQKILAEEIGYNKQSKMFKIYVVERPLFSLSHNNRSDSEEVLSGSRGLADVAHTPVSSFVECIKFLEHFQECERALQRVEEETKLFCDNYMMVHGYLDDAKTQVHRLYQECCRIFLNSLNPSLKSDVRVNNNVARSIESFILGRVHRKLFPIVCKECKNKDQALNSKLRQLRQCPPSVLGIRRELCCPLPSAVEEFSKLDGYHTPLEKMMCLKVTMDRITSEINAHVIEKCTESDKELPCLTSDDYIPLIVLVLSRSEAVHIQSNIHYMENFHWSTRSTDDLNYSMVTVQAAIQYVMNTDVRRLAKAGEDVKDAEAIEKDNRMHRSLHAASAHTSETSTGRVDRELERITRILDAPTRDFIDANRASGIHNTRDAGMSRSFHAGDGPQGQNRGQEGAAAGLGAFLSSLRDEPAHCSHGKQT